MDQSHMSDLDAQLVTETTAADGSDDDSFPLDLVNSL